MKICFLTEKIGSVGGVQRVVLTLANELSKHHHVTVLSIMDQNTAPMYETHPDLNIDMNPTLMKSSFLSKVIRSLIKISNKKIGYLNNQALNCILEKAYFPSYIQKRFINYINENHFDVVIGAEGFCSLLLGTIKHELKCPVIGWQHNSYEAYFNTKGKYYWNECSLFKRIIPQLNHYIVLTEDDKKNIRKYLNIESTFINNPLSFYSQKKTSLKNKKIISLGRFHIQKGFDHLIEAFKLIADKNEEWILEIYGEGEEKISLQKMIEENNLQQRVFLKPVTKEVEKVLSDASIYAMSSRWEGFGLVVTEALECGVPVVAFNTTGPTQILEGHDCGILVERENVDAFAQALNSLINDDEYCKRLSLNAIERAKDFSVETIANEWLNIITG